jgi:hypothetical protein
VSRRFFLAIAVLVLGTLLLPAAASPQPTAPLEVRLFFPTPPPNSTFDPTTPIKISLQIRNISGANVITIDGFSATDFWRRVYFDLEGFGIITKADAAAIHAFTPFGTCHYRDRVLVPSLQVVPVEVLPTSFALQFTFDDARTQFDLTRPGRYTVTAKIALLTYEAGAIITNCDIEFSGKSLLSIGDAGTVGRQQFDLVSNNLEFVIAGSTAPGDLVAPATTVAPSPAANAAGWSSQDVTLTFTAADNAGGSGVKNITVTLAGAQTGTQTFTGASGSVGITTEGTTTVSFNAEDNAGNKETIKSLTVRLDKTAPVVTPPAAISVNATEAGGARGSASSALAAFLGAGSAADNLDPSPARLAPQTGGADADNSTLFPPGPTTVAFRFQDVAGNIGSASSTVTVVAIGKPVIAGAVVAKGVQQSGVRYYDLRFTNTGAGLARNVSVNQLLFRTLSGSGTVTYNSSLSPAVPIAIGDLAAGASSTVRVFLNVPSTVTRFSITENGQVQDTAGNNFTFSIGQATFP